MDILKYIIAGLLLLVAFLISRAGRSTRKKVRDICKDVSDQTVKKRENKEKILVLLREKGNVSNEDIREHLGVTSRTVVNYMDDLEKEGQVEQVGETGRGVVYRAK